MLWKIFYEKYLGKEFKFHLNFKTSNNILDSFPYSTTRF